MALGIGTAEGWGDAGVDYTFTNTPSAPTISGTVAGQQTTDAASVTPFSGVRISDLNSGQSEVLTITLSSVANGTLTNLGGGFYANGAYSVSGTAAAVTAAVDGLVFVPTAHQVAAGQSVTTTFTIIDSDTPDGLTARDSRTSVVATASTVADDAVQETAPANLTVSAGQQTAISGVQVVDDGLNGETFAAGLSATSGALSVTAASGVIVNGNGTGTVTIGGTLAQVNATLATLTYSNSTAGGTTITFLTQDSDNSQAQKQIAVTVNTAAPTKGLQINLIPDASVNSAPAGFAAAVAAAASILEQTITDNITLNIEYGWGTFYGQYSYQLAGTETAIGDPNTNQSAILHYGTLNSLLVTHANKYSDPAIVAALPSSAGLFPGGADAFFVSSAQQKALNDFGGNASAIDGAIGFGTAWTDPTSWVGAALHELTHAMGRVTESWAGSPTILDMYHYSAPGVFDWVGGTPSYFSIDGGVTPLANFGTATDYADWANDGLTPTDPFDQNVSSNSLTAQDLSAIQALGFATNPESFPKPTTVTIQGAVSDQAVLDDSTIMPFSGVYISDPNTGQTDTVTVALSDPANGTLSNLGPGVYDASTGVYTVTGSAATVSAALQGLVFNPTLGQVSSGQTVTTDFSVAVNDTIGASATNTTTSVVAVASGAGNERISLKTTVETSGSSYSDSGIALIAGEVIHWTGTATVIDTPSYDTWTAYSGTMAEEILAASSPVASDIPNTQFTNSALTSIGAPFSTDGLAVWGDPQGNQADSTASDQIAYTFGSALPARTPIMLWAPGGTFNGNSGPFTFTFSASLGGKAVSTSGWDFEVEGPFGTSPLATYTPDPATGQVVVSNFSETNFPDAVILVTPNTAVDSFQVSASTIPFDFWGVAFSATNVAVNLPDDFYGDNHSDILWRQTGGSTPGAVYVWQMNGSTIVGGGASPWVDPSWIIQATGHFTGNGMSDILWGSSGGAVDLWSMNGNQVANVSYLGWVDPSLGWSIKGVGDFFGNGNTDIVWANSSSGTVDLWVTTGTQVTSAAYVGSVGPNSQWTIQGVGDFNGDGKADILWQNSATGAVDLWQMDGSTIVSNDYIASVGANSDWKMEFLADFNGDGKTDILWQNSATGAVDLWTMNGSAITSNDFIGSVGPGSDWTIQGVGDYAGNGSTDILWRNSASGAVAIWTMNGSQLSGSAYVGTVDNSWQIQHA